MTAGEAPNTKEGRRATWFELFFDLVFVAGVARLAGVLAKDFSWTGLVAFAFLFIVLWWCWIGHTFYATRFDEDRADQRVLGLAKIAAVLFIAYGAADAFGSLSIIFALGVAAFKALMAIAYAIAWRRTGAEVARLYTGIMVVNVVLWLASATLAPEALRPWFWAAGLAVDIASPFIVTRFTHSLPPHPEHLPERFGLFVIILLGESVAALVHALDHLSHPAGFGEVVLTLLAILIPFFFWWGYFENVRGPEERHVRSKADARKLQLWAYSHIPLLVGTAVMAVGGRLVVEHHAFSLAEGLLLSAATGAAMAGLTTMAMAGSRAGGIKWPYFAIAGVTALAGLLAPAIGGTGLLALLCLLAAIQTFGIRRVISR